MSQKSSVPQAVSLVSQVLQRDTPGHHGYPRAFDLIRVSAPKARRAT